jgi:hypothetical protein
LFEHELPVRRGQYFPWLSRQISYGGAVAETVDDCDHAATAEFFSLSDLLVMDCANQRGADDADETLGTT